MEFGIRLRELRSQKGISQERLANDIHISRSAVAKWENGLGIPSDESMKALSEYFGVEIDKLLPNQDSEQQLVSKNKVISRQKKVIFILAFLIGMISVVLIGLTARQLQKPVLDYLPPIILGILIIMLGIFNMQGNIASIHWYQRRKVTKENQKIYGRFMGFGTILVGFGAILSSVQQMLFNIDILEFGCMALIIVGFALMVYAQFKYNRGLF